MVELNVTFVHRLEIIEITNKTKCTSSYNNNNEQNSVPFHFQNLIDTKNNLTFLHANRRPN